MTYTLKVTETNNKAGKYHYQVINDETGAIVSERKSNREYVACTINGEFYFGRLDLIGKGDHGRRLKTESKGKLIFENGRYVGQDGIPVSPTPIAYRK